MATKKTNFDYTTIKSYEDACKKENIDPEKLPDVLMIPEELRKTILSCYRLLIIFKAINNGWIPNWNDSNQRKYFPWFEIEASNEKPSGFGFSGSGCVSWYSGAGVGSRLCCDSSEKALYIANQFEKEYIDFILIQD